jgi:hypothetical protein
MKLAYSLIPLLTACVVASPDGVENEAQVDQALGCQTWGCGTNSPIVGDGLMFDELDASGSYANRGGLKIAFAKLGDGTLVKVRGERQSLVAYDGFGRRFVGDQLLGMIIHLHHDTKGEYEILVEKYYPQSLTFWSGAAEVVPAYDMKARKVGDLYFKDSVCQRDPLMNDPHWTGIEHATIVFQGDRYDPVAKKVWETSPSDPWFNIACAGTTPAKLHLMRHTRAGSYLWDGRTVAYDTTVAERQAMLKMFAADYCGTGRSFTIDGQPLNYNDSNHWYREALPYTRDQQEALWSEDGAICLDRVRRDTEYTVDSINEKCGRKLPMCDDFMALPWESTAHVMSAIHP